MDIIRIPRTGPRNANVQFVKLLKYISPEVHSGFDFVGTFLRSGRNVDESALRPPGYPEVPVLLECAGFYFGERKRVRSEGLYILWQLSGRRWVELGRAQTETSDWARILGPLAADALNGNPLRPVPKPVIDLQLIGQRIRDTLAVEIAGFDPDTRRAVLSIIHDQIGSSFAKSDGWVV